MDVLVLIDKLDDVVHNARTVPLTDQVRIDREEIYDILDQMRATIPEEIEQARWIVKERQEMLAEAKRGVRSDARRGTRAGGPRGIPDGDREARRTPGSGHHRRLTPPGPRTKLEMEDWADNILSTLEVNLEKFLGHPPRASGSTSARRRPSSPA